MSSDALQRAYTEAASRAVAAFPIVPGSIDLVSIAENVTFRVRDARSREDFVLRLHRPGYNSLAELESERRWTQALANEGLATPTGISTDDGRFFVRVPIPGADEQRYVGMTRWMDGSPLDELLGSASATEAIQDAYHRIGGIAARMHRIAEGWSIPDSFTRPCLDAAGLLGETPRWGRFWEHPALSESERRHLRALSAELSDDLEAYGRSAHNFGLIHADLHAENIIVSRDDGNGEDERTAVIDFDDTAFGWYVYDLATALLDHWGEPHFAALRDALLNGYCAVRRLGPQDIAILDRLVLLRALTLIGWYAARPEHDAEGYFQRVCDLILSQKLREADGQGSPPGIVS